MDNSCIKTRGALPEEERCTRNYCEHIAKAREALALKNYAEVVTLDLQTVLSKVTDEIIEEAFKHESLDGGISVYVLPGKHLAVPLLGFEKKTVSTDFVHLIDLKCELDSCTKKVKSKKHTLVTKGVPVCPHSLLGKSKPNLKAFIQRKFFTEAFG